MLLQKHGMLPIAVLRGVWAKLRTGAQGNRLPYVVCNPHPDTKLNKCDRIFVLSLEQPDLSTFLKPQRNEDSGMAHLIEVVRAMEQKMEERNCNENH